MYCYYRVVLALCHYLVKHFAANLIRCCVYLRENCPTLMCVRKYHVYIIGVMVSYVYSRQLQLGSIKALSGSESYEVIQACLL